MIDATTFRRSPDTAVLLRITTGKLRMMTATFEDNAYRRSVSLFWVSDILFQNLAQDGLEYTISNGIFKRFHDRRQPPVPTPPEVKVNVDLDQGCVRIAGVTRQGTITDGSYESRIRRDKNDNVDTKSVVAKIAQNSTLPDPRVRGNAVRFRRNWLYSLRNYEMTAELLRLIAERS